MLHDVVMWRALFRATRVRRRPRWQMDRIGELDESQKLQKDLYEMELERINFMLRNYLRDRLRKVRRHTHAPTHRRSACSLTLPRRSQSYPCTSPTMPRPRVASRTPSTSSCRGT